MPYFVMFCYVLSCQNVICKFHGTNSPRFPTFSHLAPFLPKKRHRSQTWHSRYEKVRVRQSIPIFLCVSTTCFSHAQPMYTNVYICKDILCIYLVQTMDISGIFTGYLVCTYMDRSWFFCGQILYMEQCECGCVFQSSYEFCFQVTTFQICFNESSIGQF